MITLKGAEVSAKIKEQVLAMNGKLGGYVPTAAIVRIGERPDDLSYERNVMKRIAAYGMETKSYVYPADITEEEFFAEFQKINDDEAIDGILLFRPLPKYINEKRAEQMIRPEKDLDGICAVNTAKVFAGEKDGFAPCTAEAVIEVLKAFDIPMEGKRAVIVGRKDGRWTSAVHVDVEGKRDGDCVPYKDEGLKGSLPGSGHSRRGGR